MADKRIFWDILLRFYEFRGWRVVDAKDATGRQTQCLLLPMDVNSIHLTESNPPRPYMNLFCAPVAQGRSADGFFRSVTPVMSSATHNELVEKGLIDKEATVWCRSCGGIRPYGYSRRKNER